MRKLLPAILSILLLAACTNTARRNQHSALVKADSLCSVQPDSALALLSQLESEMQQADKATRMYYQLLCIKASDKAYITHTSDSLVQEVLQYYIRKNDRHHLPEAYYYAGRVCRDLSDAPQALDYFQKAIDILPTEGEYELKSRIYSQMGMLFLYQDVYEEAIKANRQSLQCSYNINDTIGAIYSLRDIGTNFTAFHQTDSALYYYNQAYELAVSFKDQEMQGIVLRALTSIYLQLGDTEMAQTTLQKSLKCYTDASKLAIVSLSANLHKQIGNLDSATYFYQQLFEIGDIFDCYDAHKGLAYIANKKGNIQSVLYHTAKYQQCHDSIIDSMNSESIRKMQSLYNYQLREKENNRLKSITAKQREMFFIISIIFLVFISLLSIYILYNRYRHIQTLRRLRELEIIKDKQYRYSIERLEENKVLIAELEKQLKEYNSPEAETHRMLHTKKLQIEQVNNEIEIEQYKKEKAIKEFRKSDIYKKFHQAESLIELTEEDWDVLQTEIDNTYIDFTNHLYALFPLSNIELKICLLLKCGIPVSRIASLIGRSKSAVTSARKKLYEKINNKKGTPDMFDKIIDEL